MVAKSRSPHFLSLAEREEISRGVLSGLSFRDIAARLHRSPSTISREITRNGSVVSYRAHLAEKETIIRARRPKAAKLALNPTLRGLVEAKLELRWSPQQISAWLSMIYPDNCAGTSLPSDQCRTSQLAVESSNRQRAAIPSEPSCAARRSQPYPPPEGARNTTTVPKSPTRTT